MIKRQLLRSSVVGSVLSVNLYDKLIIIEIVVVVPLPGGQLSLLRIKNAIVEIAIVNNMHRDLLLSKGIIKNASPH